MAGLLKPHLGAFSQREQDRAGEHIVFAQLTGDDLGMRNDFQVVAHHLDGGEEQPLAGAEKDAAADDDDIREVNDSEIAKTLAKVP